MEAGHGLCLKRSKRWVPSPAIATFYRFMRAAAALTARSLVFPVLSRIFASVTLGPNCEIGVVRFLLSVLPRFSEIRPS